METFSIKNLEVTIKSGELVSIIGPNGCGKTTLLKKICGRIKNNDILIDNKNLSLYSLDYKRNNIVCVFDDNIYNTRYVKDELIYYLNILNLDEVDIKNRIDDFVDYFSLDNIINKEFDMLNTENRVYIKLLSLLVINSSLFCVDNLFCYLNKDKKTKILNYIKERNITLLNVTCDNEELLIYDKILVINKGKVEMFDKTEIVLKNENLFNELGLSLPFIYDINNMLKSYELINEEHYNSKELVDLLWK